MKQLVIIPLTLFLIANNSCERTCTAPPQFAITVLRLSDSTDMLSAVPMGKIKVLYEPAVPNLDPIVVDIDSVKDISTNKLKHFINSLNGSKYGGQTVKYILDLNGDLDTISVTTNKKSPCDFDEVLYNSKPCGIDPSWTFWPLFVAEKR